MKIYRQMTLIHVAEKLLNSTTNSATVPCMLLFNDVADILTQCSMCEAV